MNIGELNEKLLHSIISISDKIIEEKLKISKFDKNAGYKRKPDLGTSEYFARISDLTDVLDDIKNEMKDLRENASTTTKVYPNSHDGYLYLAIYYRNQYILDKQTENKDAAKWLTEAEDQIRIAELIRRENIVVKAIKRDIEGLRKYDDETKQPAAAEAAEPAPV